MTINLDADLVPGVGAAGLFLGQLILSLLEVAAPASIEPRVGLRVLKYGPVWVFDREGLIAHVCVFGGYRGTIAGAIGVGALVSQVEAAFGPLEDLEWNEYEVVGMPGWCFGVDAGSPAMSAAGWSEVRIASI